MTNKGIVKRIDYYAIRLSNSLTYSCDIYILERT